jgi:hypothetical protein
LMLNIYQKNVFVWKNTVFESKQIHKLCILMAA